MENAVWKNSPAFSTNLRAVYKDCMNLLAVLKDGSIDIVYADPPFNFAKDYGDRKDKGDLDSGKYLRWCYRWIDECVGELKTAGQCSSNPRPPVKTPTLFIDWRRAA